MLAVTAYYNVSCREKCNDNYYKKRFKKSTLFNCDYVVYGEESTINLISNARGSLITHSEPLSYLNLIKLFSL